MLRGRAAELSVLEALVRRARHGQGGGVVLHGEAGIGKSALLDHARSTARDMLVLDSVGVEAETELGYAALRRLVAPAMTRRDHLPAPQARALGVALGEQHGPAPDRFLVSLATLSLLSEIAAERSLLCLVDDAHWTDRESLDVISFIARRLEVEPIAVILASRPTTRAELSGTGLTEVEVTSLSDIAARELLVDHGGAQLSPPEQDALLRASRGNPLAIREFVQMGRQQPGGGEPLPVDEKLRRTFIRQVRQHGDGVRRLLLLAAADNGGQLAVLRRAAAALGVDTAPLDGGDLEDFVAIGGSTVVFRHPLIRSAVYHDADALERQTVHSALAAALAADATQVDRRAWHLGQAATEPNERVAVELEQSALWATRRAGPAAAASAYVRAAQLSETRPERSRRFVEAAASWLEAGDTAQAAELLEKSDFASSSVADLDQAEVRALIEARAGAPREAVALLHAIIPHIAASDRRRAYRLLTLLGESAFLIDEPAAWFDIISALETVPASGDDVYDAMNRVFLAGLRAFTAVDSTVHPEVLRGLERLEDPMELYQASTMAWFLGDFESARRLWQKAEHTARLSGSAGTLAWILWFAINEEIAAGRYGAAEAYAEEAFRLAAETGQPNTACRNQSQLVLIAALRGRDQQAWRLAEAVIAEATTRGLHRMVSECRHALGLVDLAAGRYERAADMLGATSRYGAEVSAGTREMVPDFVEAAVRAGQFGHAETYLAQYQDWAEATRAPSSLALAARARALLAPVEEATTEYRRALRYHAASARPFDEARTQLLLGEHLLRHRQRADARLHLRAALRIFTRLGSPMWAQRAQQELRAAGETTTRPEAHSLGELTPQEMRIALAVVEGATNREIGAQLFLSPRTVAYHLRKVFHKTGIASRSELVRLILANRQPGRPSVSPGH